MPGTATAALLFCLCLAPAASAATLTWTGATDGNWFYAGNWSPGQTPTSTDDVIIDSNGVVTISGATPASFNTLTLGDSSGSIAPTLKISGTLSSAGLLTVNPNATVQQDTLNQLTLAQVVVVSGGVITHAANSTTRAKIVNLNVTGSFDLQAGASITVNGLGYAGGAGWRISGSGPGGAPGASSDGGSGGGHAGIGGTSGVETGGSAYDSLTNPSDLGSGGSGAYNGYAGGAGGGAVILNVGGTFSLDGSISANGAGGVATPQGYGSGAGAGGTVNLTVNTLSGTGVVRANGGLGGSGSNTGGAGGAGGRVALVVTGTDSSSLTLQADGGNGSGNAAGNGGAGTIAKLNGGSVYSLVVGDLAAVAQAATPLTGASLALDAVTLGNATVNFDAGSAVTINTLETTGAATINRGAITFAAGVEIQSGGVLALNAASTSGGALLIDGGGTFKQLNTTQFSFASVNVMPGGLLTHAANTTTRTSVLNLSVVNDFNLQAGATMTASGLGYAGGATWRASGSGPGGGPGANSDGGSGGGHGGAGGASGTEAGGITYDTAASPTDLGSGGSGAYNGYPGGAGGGAVLLSVGGNLYLNGLITTNGSGGVATPQGYGSGGGAGGSVNLTAAAMSGTGTVQANGGAGGSGSNTGGGGGGGGRVAIVVTGANSSALSVQANAGNGTGNNGGNGGSGVVALKSGGDAAYSLSVGNLIQTPQAGSGVAGSAPSFLAVTLNNGILNFDAGSTVTINSLVVDGTATINGSNFSFGSAAPVVVQPGASLVLRGGMTSFPMGSPIEVKGLLAMAVNSNVGGALNVRSGGIFKQLNTQLLNFDSALVESGGVMSHSANVSSRAAVLNLNVAGGFNLQAGGIITANGLGYAGGATWHANGNGPGGGPGANSDGGSGGGHGGIGGTAGTEAGGSAYDSVTNPTDLGSGGSGAYNGYPGGAGGGAILLNVGGALSLNGTISASGAGGVLTPPSYGSGAGAGGTINLTANTLSGTGTVQANGGIGGAGVNIGGGGGAGGRVAIVVSGADTSSLSLQADAGNGGGNSTTSGGAGVIARLNGGPAYNLIVGDLAETPFAGTPLTGASLSYDAVTLGNSVVNFDSGSAVSINTLQTAGSASINKGSFTFAGSLEVKPGGLLMLNAAATTGGALTVDGGATFKQMNAAQFGFASVNVLPGGTMTHAPNTTTRSSVLNLNVANDFNLQAGASIAVTGLGYAGGSGWHISGSGPGGGPGAGSDGGSGGGHGGTGGSSGSEAGGTTYDSASNPTDLGSGGSGAYNGYPGGAGGGAVLLNIGGSLFINGQIVANGGNGVLTPPSYGSGGGSGGTVNITANAMSGAGGVQVVGGAGGAGTNIGGGGGGGGRAVLTGCSSNSVAATGAGGAGHGTNGGNGANGTVSAVVPPSCPSAPPAPTNVAVLSSGENAAGQTYFTISWSSAAQAVYYTVQASTAADFTGVQLSTTVSTTSGTIVGLVPNATYYLRAAAFNGIGGSPYSASISALTPVDLTAPSAPTFVSAVGRQGGSIALGWQTAASGEQTFAFNVYRTTYSFASVAGVSPLLLHTSATSYVDSPAADGTYFYAVTALDPSFNESGLSNGLSALSIHAPNAPISGLLAAFDPSLERITLNWPAPSTGTAVTFNVYRSTYSAPLAGATLLQGGSTATAYVDSPSLSQDATYFYQVTSLNPVGAESAASNLASTLFDVHAPSIQISRVTGGEYTSASVTPSIVITDYSPWVSTVTLNGQPFQSSPIVYSSPSQTVSEGGTASVSCSSGTILSYSSIWAANCTTPHNCGTCPIDGTSCSFTYNNSNCGDAAPGCSKNGTLTLNCGSPGTTLTQAGTYFLSVQAQDFFANASSATLGFTIDRTSPTLTFLSPVNGLVTNQTVLVVYVATDDFTPAAQISVADGQGHAFSSSTTITSEGLQTLSLTARDLAGNQTTSTVAFTLDKTPPSAVTDLRATNVNVASGTINLAWTVPSDNLTGVAGATILVSSGTSFSTIVGSQSISGPLTTGATATFALNLSTQQPVYLAVESADGVGNVSPLSNSVLFNPIPPQTSVTPAPGSVLSRPANISVQVADVAAITQVSFWINGGPVAVATSAPYSFFWDTRNYPDGSYTLLVTAQDATGNITSSSASYVLSYAPPAVPVLTSPATGYVTNVATVTVAGTAEGGTTVQLLINGSLAGNVYLASSGGQMGFQFPNVPLVVEGANAITARSVDSLGTSANAPTIQVTLLQSPPSAPSGVSANSAAGGLIALSWVAISTDTSTSFYKVYRSTDPALLPAGGAGLPSLLAANNVHGTQINDTPPIDGVYYYALTAKDAAGNESGLSDLASAVSDRVPPTAVFSLDFATAPLGPGTYPADLSLSKVLAQPPLLTFTAPGGNPSPLPLSPLAATLWHTTVTVTSAMSPGNALLGFSGTDLVGNVGIAITSGRTLALDTRGPVATISLSSASPVTTGVLGVSVALDKPAASTPTLTVSLQGGATLGLNLSAASGDSRSWTGQIAITNATGDGTATFNFAAVDILGNISNAVAGTTSFVIKTLPPGPPVGLRPNSLAGGRVSLSWSAPGGQTIAFYRVYRDAAFLATAPHDGVGAFVDPAPDGVHQYGVSSVDPAGNESSSAAALGVSKSIPPSAPVQASSLLNASSQIQVSWQSGSTDTARYLLYRATAAITSLAGLTPRDAVPPFIDVPDQDANYHYVVTGLDQAGNESAPSNETMITFDRAGPQITVSGIRDGGLYNATVYPTFSALSLILDTSSVLGVLDGQAFVSGSAVAAEGVHTLSVSAANMTGHVSSATASFALDKTPPVIVLGGIQGGQLLKSSAAVIVSMTDLHPGTTTLLLYNQLTSSTASYNSGDVITLNGQYTLSAYATDAAGNTSTATLSFQMDIGPLPPSNLVVQIQGSANLSWRQPEPDVIAYRVYRDGINVSGSFLRGTTFVDPGFTAGSTHVYEVSAVDAQGVEGGRTRASVPAVALSVPPIPFTRGYFDAVELMATNASTTSFTVGPAVISLFDGHGLVTAATATPVAVAPGLSSALEADVATPVSLATAVSVMASLSLPTDPGAAVLLQQTVTMSAADPQSPLLEIFPAALVPGTLGSVQVRLYNRGSAPMDIPTAQVSGGVASPVNNLQIRLRTPDGTLLATGNLQQTAGASAAVIPGRGQVDFLSIPGGQSSLFGPIQVLVPNTAAGNLIVEAAVSTPTSNLPFLNMSGSRGFLGQTNSAVVQSIPYTATVAPSQAVFDQGQQQIALSGRASDSNGMAVAAASVTVHVIQNGYDRQLQAVTDSSGAYTVFFNPAPSEAGIYSLFAANPQIVSGAIQSSFTIEGMTLNYGSYSVGIVQSASLSFKINLTNTGANVLTGFRVSTANVSATGVTLTIDPATVPQNLAAGQSATLKFTVAAAAAASGGTLSFAVGESHGFFRALPISVQVSQALPNPGASPQAFQVGVLAGQTQVQSITLSNTGFAPWTGVTLTSPTLDWVQLLGSPNVGDIPPGGNANISLAFNPPATQASAIYNQNPLLQVISSNAATIPINVGVTVTSSKQGALVFNVINADKPKDLNGLGIPVGGAAVALTSVDVPGLTFHQTVDANGIAQFVNIPTGNYAWTASAQGFQTNYGSSSVDPGLTKTVQSVMASAAVTYTWTVTPTTIVDKYNVGLNLTFKTDVPAPIVVIDPTVLTFDVASHVDAFGQFTVTNLGLVSAFNVVLAPNSPDGEVYITLPFSTIAELKAGQSVTVPFKISHGQVAGGLPHCHTNATMAAAYNYTCAYGTTTQGKVEPLKFNIGTPGVCGTPASVSIAASGGGSGGVPALPAGGASIAVSISHPIDVHVIQPDMRTNAKKTACQCNHLTSLSLDVQPAPTIAPQESTTLNATPQFADDGAPKNCDVTFKWGPNPPALGTLNASGPSATFTAGSTEGSQNILVQGTDSSGAQASKSAVISIEQRACFLSVAIAPQTQLIPAGNVTIYQTICPYDCPEPRTRTINNSDPPGPAAFPLCKPREFKSLMD